MFREVPEVNITQTTETTLKQPLVILGFTGAQNGRNSKWVSYPKLKTAKSLVSSMK